MLNDINQQEFSTLKKNIYELNSLLELTFISNQVSSIEPFLQEVKNFLLKNISDIKVYFLYNNEFNVLHSLLDSDLDIQIDLNEEHFQEDLQSFLTENATYFSPYSSGDYNNFLKRYNLELIKPNFIKEFSQDCNLKAVCLIHFPENIIANEEKILFYNKIFSFIEPIIFKFLKKQSEDLELKKLHKTLKNISVLYSISQTVNFIDDLKRLLKVILSKALDTIDAEKASLMFYDYSENSLQVKYVYGLPDKNIEMDINNGIIECTKIKAGSGIAGTVFIEKKAIISNLGQNDPRFYHSHELSHTTSLLCVPLIVKGEAIGVINVSNKKGNKLFTRSDLEFMEALANQAAIAVDNANLYELATRDGLTKLYIYRHFYTLLTNEIKRAGRYEHPLSILMMDIDNFKSINDTYGHPVGDLVLKEIANTIKTSVRKVDIPARYGGEEFCVILPETKGEDACLLANRLRNNISKLQVKVKNDIFIKPTVSVGIAEFPSCAEDEQTLIELADIALYQAKNAGKNVVYQYTPMGCQVVDKNLGL